MHVLVVERVGVERYFPNASVRVVEPMEYLQDSGLIDFAVASEDDIYIPNMLAWADVIVFSKHSSDSAYELATQAKQRGLKVIYDIDDQLLAWPKEFNTYNKDFSKYIRMIELADIVTLENERLLQELSPLHHACVIIGNGVYTEKYAPADLRRPRGQSYIFTGYVKKLKRFEKTFTSMLRDIHHKYRKLVLSLHGDYLYDLMSMSFVRQVPISGYRDYFNSVITGNYLFSVTPLSGHEDPENVAFNKCKSPIKYITYGFAGIPGIYSNVLPYKAHVTDGETGLLVENSYDAWVDAIDRIINDKTLWKRICENAYSDISENYHIRGCAQRYFDAVLH